MTCRQAINKNYVIDPNHRNFNNVKANLINFINSYEGDDPLQISIEKEKKDKTEAHSNWFHKLRDIISEHTGYTKGEVKEYIKADVLGTTVVTVGDKTREVTKSSEKATRLEYSELIEGAYRMGAEAGVPLPNPDFRLR